MMLPIIFATTLFLVTEIQSQIIDCHKDQIGRIIKCRDDALKSKYGDDYSWRKWWTCEGLDISINCTHSINEDCAKSAFFGSHFIYYTRARIESNETCFDDNFDWYYNQDGMCSLQDIRDIYKCFYGKSILPLDQHAQCKEAQNVEKCIKELHPNCMGFFLRQLPLFNQLMFVQRDPSESIPECMKAFPSRANEYPILKKLVEELQQLLN